MEKTLYVDMDGTLAVWNPAAKFEDLFEKGYFRNLEPQDEIIKAVKLLHDAGVRLCVLSAYMDESPYALEEKHFWLNEHAPFIEDRIFCPVGETKVHSVIKRTGSFGSHCFLLDDYSANLHPWAQAGGVGIKLYNGINGNNGTWQGECVTLSDSAEVIAADIMQILNYGRRKKREISKKRAS